MAATAQTDFYGIREQEFVLLDARQVVDDVEGKSKFVWYLSAQGYQRKEVDGDYVPYGKARLHRVGDLKATRELIKDVVNATFAEGTPVVAQIFDKASSGFAAVYTADGKMAHYTIDSPYGLLGGRCSPLPRGRVGKADAGSVSTTLRQKTLLATRRWETLIVQVENGEFWARLGDTPNTGEVKRVKPGEPKPKGDGWVQATVAHLSVLVFPAIFGRWKGASAFGTYPQYVPSEMASTTQVSGWDDLRREVERSGKAASAKATATASTKKKKTAQAAAPKKTTAEAAPKAPRKNAAAPKKTPTAEPDAYAEGIANRPSRAATGGRPKRTAAVAAPAPSAAELAAQAQAERRAKALEAIKSPAGVAARQRGRDKAKTTSAAKVAPMTQPETKKKPQPQTVARPVGKGKSKPTAADAPVVVTAADRAQAMQLLAGMLSG